MGASETTAGPVKDAVRLTVNEVLISPLEKKDLLAIGEGYYASFLPSFHDPLEPPSKSSVPVSVRAARFAKRMEPWLTSPDGKWMKATLRNDPDGKIIGHAGWLRPVEGRHVMHHWRRDATEALGWKETMGWTEEEIEEMWENVSLETWQGLFTQLDDVREKEMAGERHWFLAPLFVIPEYQGRGVSSLLLKETLDLADATEPPTAVYLESAAEARRVYEHFGFEALPGYDIQMVRRGLRTEC